MLSSRRVCSGYCFYQHISEQTFIIVLLVKHVLGKCPCKRSVKFLFGICIGMCVCVCVVCVCCVCVYVCEFMNVFVSVCCVCEFVCVLCVFVCVCVCVCMCVCLCVCKCMFVCVYVYVFLCECVSV